MPSFLDYQEKARKRTRLLVALYLLCLIGLVAVFCAIAAAIAAIGAHGSVDAATDCDFLLDISPTLGVVALVVLLVVGIATLVKTLQLGGGGRKVAEELGGTMVLPNTRDRLERRLLNVVEEMAIASGIAIPTVYVLRNEPGINAFAAGTSANEAAVAVTRGALENLSRDELQCVIGHEFSHILNGDMRLNVRLISSIFGIVCVALCGRVLLRGGLELLARSPRRRKKDDDPAALALGLMAIGACVWLIGSIGVFFGRVLQSTISRQREYLADASAVQFTRNPVGMASALKTIGAVSSHSSLATPKAGEVSHMLFAAGAAEFLFASHPPLQERIRRFEPGFDGDYRPVYAALQRRRAALASGSVSDDDPDDAETLRTLLAATAHRGIRRAAAAQARGGAAQARPNQPAPQLDPAALRSRDEAPGIICGAVLDSTSPQVRASQLAALRGGDAGRLFPGLAAAAETWSARMAGRPMREKVAMCEIAASAMRDETPEKKRTLSATLLALIAADGAISPLEFAVVQRFRDRLEPPQPVETKRAKSLIGPIRAVLHAVAAFGAASEDARNTAFAAGVSALPASFGALGATPGDLPDFDGFSAALAALRALSPADKQALLAACSAVALADGVVTEEEETCLAAVADTIGAAGWQPGDAA